jgi:hypothetical protein
MSRLNWLISLLLIPALVTPVAAQQTHVADEAALLALVQKKLEEDAANRAAVENLFQRPEVREVAGKLGLTANRVAVASAALDGEELRLLASYAQTLDQGLAGGQWSGRVTWFAIIAVVLVLIILFAVAK